MYNTPELWKMLRRSSLAYFVKGEGRGREVVIKAPQSHRVGTGVR